MATDAERRQATLVPQPARPRYPQHVSAPIPCLRIHDRPVGRAQSPYVIAEIGVNHDGSPERAIRLVEDAAAAGADAVKVQVFRAEALMSRSSRLAAYQREAGEADPLAMLRRLELSWEALGAVVARTHDLGLHAIATVFSLELVPTAADLRTAAGRGFDAWKTASPDIIHRPLLEALAATGRPLIVSTGAATLDEVRYMYGWLRETTPCFGVLQCVSAYPTPPQHAALGGIRALMHAFPSLVVGYSDHTTSEATGADAVRLGAAILEKHLTDDRFRTGPDHAASLDPAAFARYAALARHAGTQTEPVTIPPELVVEKRLLEIETDVREVSRQSIVSRRDLPPGHRLERGDLTFKRPGTGLEPFRIGEVLGRVLRSGVAADTVVRPEDLAG